MISKLLISLAERIEYRLKFSEEYNNTSLMFSDLAVDIREVAKEAEEIEKKEAEELNIVMGKINKIGDSDERTELVLRAELRKKAP